MDGVSNRFKEKDKHGDTMIRIEGATRPGKGRRIPVAVWVLIILFIGLGILFLVSILNNGDLKEVHHSPNSEYYVYMVADRDEFSKNENTGNYESSLFMGKLTREVTNGIDVRYTFTMDETRPLKSPHIESKNGKQPRGMEISALTFWNNKLYTCCDRTGIVYEIGQKEGKTDLIMLPRYILNVGTGKTSPKGFKCEWMTTRDGMMIVGSTGKEWTTPEGVFINNDPNYVKYISPGGRIRSVDWTERFNTVRRSIHPEVLSPGYAVQESVLWNPYHKKWYFLPRRVSKQMYDDKTEIEKGAFLVISLGDNDKEAEVVKVRGETTKYRGFSEVKYVHGFSDEMVALRTEEEYHTGKTRTYMVVVTTDGELLMKETLVAEDKIEGLEISDFPFFDVDLEK